jgi:PAT family beta-lactamase induction signal transducer AmpG
MSMSGVFFKSLGADNVFIGLTSFLSLPWILKFAWSPLVDIFATKRKWIVSAQVVLFVLIMSLAATASAAHKMHFDTLVIVAVVILSLTAIASATQDVSVDGFYLDVLNEEQKSLFVGIRNTAYRVAWIFGSGAMVFLAGKLAEQHGLPFGWAVGFALCSVAMLLCAFFHVWYLPDGRGAASGNEATDARSEQHGKTSPREFVAAIMTYFDQPGIVAIVTYILIFRLGDALMLKQAPNFLLDPAAKHGLGVSVADMGMISGTVGIIALLLGGIVASFLISRHGLKRWMWPLTCIQNGAILLYFALAQWPQALAWQLPFFANKYIPAVYVVNSAEQFSYGMGVAAYTVFMLCTVGERYKAAHYATATALMALGVLVPGALSGFIYERLGYAHFFLLSFLASLPGIVTIYFLPIWRQHDGVNKKPGGKEVGVPKARQVGRESQ